MTAFDVIAMNRVSYRKTCRRQDVLVRIVGLLKCVFLILALTWFYAVRTEVGTLAHRVWSHQIAVPSLRANR